MVGPDRLVILSIESKNFTDHVGNRFGCDFHLSAMELVRVEILHVIEFDVSDLVNQGCRGFGFVELGGDHHLALLEPPGENRTVTFGLVLCCLACCVPGFFGLLRGSIPKG